MICQPESNAYYRTKSKHVKVGSLQLRFDGSVDGRIFCKLGESEEDKKSTSFITQRVPINLFEKEWLFPDPVTCLEVDRNLSLVITGSASGYLRAFYYQVSNGEVDLKQVYRLRISDLPIMQLNIGKNFTILAADALNVCYYIGPGIKDAEWRVYG